MPEIPYLKIVPSMGAVTQGDCGICSVATLTNNTYEDVVAVASGMKMKWKAGLYTKEIIKLAKHFGTQLKRRKKFDLDTDVGILEVDVTDPTTEKVEPHAVLLNAGMIIDWDGTVWSPDAYIMHYKAKVGSLLMLQQ